MVRTPRNLPPLDANRLEELALRYVARFATTRARLEAYLHRKLRERGWDGEQPAPVGELADRLVQAGYVDDAAYARAKAGSLLRRGYGMRRIGEALREAGVAGELQEQIRPSERNRRQAALAMARKRRFGPYGAETANRAVREKQLAAMLRAGHALDSAVQLVDAPSIEAAEEWAGQTGEEG